MNKLRVTFLVLLFFTVDAVSCEVFPWNQVVNNSERFFENADVVFLGKLDYSTRTDEIEQIATFSIEKVFKGGDLLTEVVTIKNTLWSSCGMLIEPIGKEFYVFANQGGSGLYFKHDYPSFVQYSYAIEHGLNLK